MYSYIHNRHLLLLKGPPPFLVGLGGYRGLGGRGAKPPSPPGTDGQDGTGRTDGGGFGGAKPRQKYIKIIQFYSYIVLLYIYIYICIYFFWGGTLITGGLLTAGRGYTHTRVCIYVRYFVGAFALRLCNIAGSNKCCSLMRTTSLSRRDRVPDRQAPATSSSVGSFIGPHKGKKGTMRCHSITPWTCLKKTTKRK